MVGNVIWKGYRLDKILSELFPQECREEEEAKKKKDKNHDEQNEVYHVIFTGVDEYETSTPLRLLLDPTADCLLATGMNGQELSPDHGYPVRVLLPGIAGCRNVKFLESIRLSKSPSTSPWNSYYYRNTDGNHIQKLPLQSIILTPQKNTQLDITASGDGGGDTNIDGHRIVKVRGVAYSGGENTMIKKVEVTADEGESWQEATILPDTEGGGAGVSTTGTSTGTSISSRHAWVRFEVDVSVPMVSMNKEGEVVKKVYIHSRAIDSNNLTQPKYSEKERGYLYNGWGKTSIVIPTS